MFYRVTASHGILREESSEDTMGSGEGYSLIRDTERDVKWMNERHRNKMRELKSKEEEVESGGICEVRADF